VNDGPECHNRPVAEARRTVCRWLLAAMIERGPQVANGVPQPRRIERPLSVHESHRLLALDRRLPILL